jgi:hypothetical protein
MDIDVDARELHKLTADLRAAPDEARDQVKAVTARGALNIKRGWQERWSGHDHIPHLPRAITYDTRVRVHDIEAEIGPDKTRPQGPLGNLIEFGSIHNAPIPGGAPALDDEEPNYLRYLGEAIARPVEG